jgi:hypothetical protein
MDEQKNEIARAIMNIEYYPAVIEKDIGIEKYTKLPIAKVSALGVAFEPLATAFQNVFNGATGTQSGLYMVTIPKGGQLAAFNDGSGFLGSVLTGSGAVGGGQARLNPLI